MTSPQKGRIFISYRRVDTSFAARSIYDRLALHFGENTIFMDVEAIDGGVDFVKVLEDAVQSCDVLVALIGKQWLNVKDEKGERRLDNPEDFVRIEIAAALNRDIRVIPILVGGATMPRSTELPENLKPLSRRNALQVSHRSFNPDANRVISHLERGLKAAEELKILKAQAVKKAARERAKKEAAEKDAQENAKPDKKQEKTRRKLKQELDKLVQRSARQAQWAERKYKWGIFFSRIRYRLSLVFDNIRSYFFPILIGLFFVGVVTYSLYYTANIVPIPSSTPVLTLTRTKTPLSATIATKTPTKLPAAIVTKTPTKSPAVIVTKTYTPTPLLEEISDIDPAGSETSMRLVPAGEFTMGADLANYDARPAHTIELDSFYIDKYEVTNIAYEACVNVGVCLPPASEISYYREQYYGNTQYNEFPVIYVNWNMARKYCEWRGKRLPTEAEWEKAARGENGERYPWGNVISCEYANFYEAGNYCNGDTVLVGSYPRGVSEYGVYDLVGNVSEWVSSRYSTYPYDEFDGRESLLENTASTLTERRVIRGVSWGASFYLSPPVYSRSSSSISTANNSLGFRCAKDAP